MRRILTWLIGLLKTPRRYEPVRRKELQEYEERERMGLVRWDEQRTCAHCGAVSEYGLIGGGIKFYCEKKACVEVVLFQRREWCAKERIRLRAKGYCEFINWSHCGHPPTQNGFCAYHSSQRCHCGAQATHENDAGYAVCDIHRPTYIR